MASSWFGAIRRNSAQFSLTPHALHPQVELDNGCVCCGPGAGELAPAVASLRDRRADGGAPAFDHVVVELSGGVYAKTPAPEPWPLRDRASRQRWS